MSGLQMPVHPSGPSILALFALVLAISGCGGISHSRPDETRSTATIDAPSHMRIPVTMGAVTAASTLPVHLQEPVRRYLLDVAKEEITRHRIFLPVDASAGPDLLAEFGFEAETVQGERLEPRAALDVHVLNVEERLGPTVSLGFASSQQKIAIAEVRIVLRYLDSDTRLTSEKQGRSSKGAWGVVAAVDRESMREGAGVWQLDGSMVGIACAEAANAAIEDVARQALYHFRALSLDAEKKIVKNH